MSASETIYTFRDWGQVVLERGREQVTKQEVYRDGALVAPTEAGSSYTLYDADGSTVLHTDSVTVASSVATITIPASALPSTLDYGEDYREEWTLVLPDGSTRVRRRDVAIARQALNPVITDLDLLGEYPDLSRDFGTVLTSFQPLLDEAWRELLGWLRQKGTILHLIVSDYDLRRAHKHGTLYLVFKWFFRHTGGGETWLRLMEEHKAAYEDALAKMTVRIDSDQDGVPDEGRDGVTAIVGLNPAPRRRMRRHRWW